MNPINRMARLARAYLSYKSATVTPKSLPVRLWIEPSFRCNIKCVMCPNRDTPARQKGVMDMALFEKIVGEAKDFASDIYLHHRGEPLMNRNLPEMIALARENGLRVRFHTNATLIDEAAAEKLVEAAPDMVSISFDGFQKDIYEEVRVGARFEKTVGNIVGLLEARARKKSRKPYVIIEKIDFEGYRDRVDEKEVEKLTKRFRAAGIDEIIEKKEYIWVTESAPEMAARRTYTQCTMPWYAMVICWDGTVTPCPQDFHAGMTLGNVREKSIGEIWNDEPYRLLRSRLIEDIESLALCSRCDRLCRPRVGGLPLQYLVTFLTDHLIGYGRVRKLIGSFERN